MSVPLGYGAGGYGEGAYGVGQASWVVGPLPVWLPTAEAIRNELPGRKAALEKLDDNYLNELILRRYISLRAEVPVVLTPALHGPAREYLILAVASQLEDQLFPEQSSLDGSNAERLDRRAGAELARLRTALSGETDGQVAWSGTVRMGGR